MNTKKARFSARMLCFVLSAFVGSWILGCSNDSTTVAPGDPVENRKKKADALQNATPKQQKAKKANPGDDI